MAGASFQLKGYAAANRGATIHLRNALTGVEIERAPFLDGSLTVRDIEPGNYEMTVRHENLIQPIDQRRIRIFPQPQPTFVPVAVPPELFRDTPIRDIPDADLAPVQGLATAARDRLAPIAVKSPGEAIRAADWNALVGVVGDLATAVLQLTSLVSPTGHAHPEIEEKIGEVQGNIRRFAEAFGASLLGLRREIETANLRKTVNTVVNLATGPEREAIRTRLIGRVAELEETVGADTASFTQKLAAAGNQLLLDVNTLAVGSGTEATDFLAKDQVKALIGSAEAYRVAGTQVKPELELQTYARTALLSGGPFKNVVGG